MWKAPRHIADDGLICLVLPSKVFLNRTDEFQQKWFEHHCVEEVLQLADLRFILFENAVCPAVVVRYRNADPTADSYDIDYISPQASRSDPRRGVVVITPQDRQRIASRDIIRFAKRDEAPSLWKMYLRGTPRDVRLLGRLMDYPRLESLVGSAAQPKRFWSGHHLASGIKELHWKDFELLVDLVFRAAGWIRESVLGQHAKGLDLELREPIMGDKYIVQVKSQAGLADVVSTAEQFSHLEYRRIFFVVHSPENSITIAKKFPKRVEIVTPERLAAMAADAGLARWIEDKVS